MKTRAILGTLVAVALSLLFAGTALAAVVDATYPPGDPKAFIVTEWKITPDGRLHVAGESTVANGFSGSIVGVGKNGEPSLITFDKKEDMAAAYKARNWELPSMLEPGMLSMASGSANINCYAEIWNPTYKINMSMFCVNYAFSDTHITYFAKDPFSFSNAQNGWAVYNGPNYTAPVIPTSTSALGTYNTSFTGLHGE